MTDTFIDERANGESAAAELHTTLAVRERCGQLLARARAGQSRWFEVNDSALDAAARHIQGSTRNRYPRGTIPLHSRWRHFEAGGVDRKAELDRQLGAMPATLRARALFDLAIVSVLLDGGAGADWTYVEPATGRSFQRSEGLAVASFHAFTAGLFSSDRDRPLQADALGLRGLVTDHLAAAFQVRENNPLVGLEQRAVLLRRLGEVIAEEPEVFGEEGVPRPGGLFDTLVTAFGPEAPAHTAEVDAHDILSQVLLSLSGIWPYDNQIGGVPLGDCWRHEAVRGEGPSAGWVPLHKLSQWMVYSLLEPLEWCGVQVRGIDRLTGLAEYRNGGLMIDSGVLRLRDPQAAQRVWQPGDEIIVEWRALTVSLLDELAPRVRTLLKVPEDRWSLGRMLEGGSWAAGRDLAQKARGGQPPLQVQSDGTVF